MKQTMDRTADISILMASYNRAEILRRTLSAMAEVDRSEMHIEIVVIDNNSTDHTKQVAVSFEERLPVRYLFEPRAGKNKALNHALDTIELGEIVVFCDDDIVPAKNWLHEIVKSTQRWPHYSVFGGKIYLVWPESGIPGWAECPNIHGWAFTRHDEVSEQDSPYPAGGHPGGPNFWVRRNVFDDGRRYDESIGPQAGGKFFMGSETSFLFQLARDGYPAIHIPEAAVGHRVQPELLTPESIKKRAYRYGGGFYHLRPLPRRQLLQKHPQIWRLIQSLVLAKWALYYVGSWFSTSSDRRLLRQLTAIRWMACNVESFNVAANEYPAKDVEHHKSEVDPRISVQFVPYWRGNPYQNQLSEHLSDQGIRMQQGSSLKEAFRRFFFKGQRFNILHIHWLPAIVKPGIMAFVRTLAFLMRLRLLKLAGVKIVWTIHNLQSHEARYPTLDRWVRRAVAKMSRALITHSRATRREAAAVLGLKKKDNLFVVPHGNYIHSYHNTVTRKEARKQLHITEDKFIVLFIGGVRPYKGVPELIEGFKTVDGDRAFLLIAGKAVSEQYAAELEEQISGCGNIRWDQGFIEDDRIQYYMAASDVAAFTYRHIFSSGAVALAMSFGRPCIAPATAIMQEIFNGSGAFLYEPQSADGLRNAIKESMQKSDLLPKMGEHNLQLAKQWDWDDIAAKTADVYRWSLADSKEAAVSSSALQTKPVTEGSS